MSLLDAPPAPGSTPTTRPRPRALLPLLLVGLVLLLVVGIAATASRTTRDTLSPTSVSPDGSRAVARVLDGLGVDVQDTQTFATATEALESGGGPGTLVLTDPAQLSPSRLQALREAVRDSGSTLVLLAPTQDALDVLAPGVDEVGPADDDVVEPACSAADALAAGGARAGGRVYEVSDGVGCYPAGSSDGRTGASWVDLPASVSATGARVVVVGQPELLMNRYGAEDGNAALALRTLGSEPDVVWYRPAAWDVEPGDARPLSELLPAGLLPGLALVVVAAAVMVVGRARRFGRVVVEPLPVVVRSVETVEGRARLYHRGNARGRAAEALRSAAISRLRARVRLDAGAPDADVADAVAWATGSPPDDVRRLLLSGVPADDAELVALARDLDDLERRVRRTS